MSATLHCPNGHDWSSRLGPMAERVDQCPICGATPEASPTLGGEPPTVVAPRSQLPPTTPADGWTGSADVAGLASVPVPGYEIISELGRGGMGVVFKAKQTAVNRIVALKMILAGELASEGDLRRFRDEAEAAAHLQHPNIVQLYEFGEVRSGGVIRPYFALEFVAGGSLAESFDGTPRPAKSSAEMMEVIARAMHYAHTQGVIHRDLKPGNILLGLAGNRSSGSHSGQSASQASTVDYSPTVPKITDFGLAKRMDSMSDQTRSGAVMGTPQYMAPEQASGQSKRAGPGTDIYALGAVLYEMITGRPPFQGETPLQTIMQVTRDEPVAPRMLNPSVPRDLETICLKCLRKQPEQRYASALDLADDLHRFLEGQPIAARPAGPIERARAWVRRHPTATALITVTTAAAATLVLIGYRSHIELKAKNKELSEQQAELLRQKVDLLVANGARMAEEGDLILALPWYAGALQQDKNDADKAANHRIRLAAAMENSPKLNAVWLHPGRVTDGVFRPDGKQVATAGEYGQVRVWDIDNPASAVHTLKHDGGVAQIAYSADGKKLLVRHAAGPESQNVTVWDLTKEPPARVSLPASSAVTCAAWIPNSPRLLMATANGMQVWDAETGKMLPLEFRNQRDVTAIAVNKNGTRVAIGDRSGKVRVWDLAKGEAVSKEFEVPGPVKVVALSDNGERLMTAAGKTAQLWNVQSGEKESPELSHRQELADAALSPNGKLVGTASLDDTGGVWDLDRNEWADDVLKHGSDVMSVAFSPDDKWVATTSDDNTARVWDARHAYPRTPPLPHVGTVSRARFSPDGEKLLTIANDGMAKLWNLPPAKSMGEMSIRQPQKPEPAFSADRRYRIESNGNSAQVYSGESNEPISGLLKHQGNITHVEFSGDGTRVATASADRSAQVWDWKKGEAVGQPLRHGSPVNDVRFSADGKLVATGGDDNTARVWNAETGQPITPPLAIAGSVLAVRFSPDGKRILAAGKNPLARVWDTARGDALAVVSRETAWVDRILKDAASTVAWDLHTTDKSLDQLRDEAEWRSGHRLDSTGGLAPIDGKELQEIGKRVNGRGE